MQAVIKSIFYFGPLIFGIGFMVPLTADILNRTGADIPFGISPLVAGLVVGTSLGLIAQIRGRWI